MESELFNYDLPEELIAQNPPKIRGNSRLLVVDRQKETLEHKRYSDIGNYINPGDCVVLNNTRVNKARLYGTIKRSGRTVECLAIKALSERRWEFILTRAKYIKSGDEILIANNCRFKVLRRIEKEPLFLVEFVEKPEDLFDRYGHTPLPPYISREDTESDYQRYNTVFSKFSGSSASPTASLNLTAKQLLSFEAKEIWIAYVTLHVGWGTFAPVRTKRVEDFKIHSEKYSVDSDTINKINLAKKSGKKVIAFGTTATRALESAYSQKRVSATTGETSLFIYPGYRWKCVDALVTNFHAPNSSLLMLVAAFAGYDLIRRVYDEAISERYRFLSYGDSMLIV